MAQSGSAMTSFSPLSTDVDGGESCPIGTSTFRTKRNGEKDDELCGDCSKYHLPIELSDEKGERSEENKVVQSKEMLPIQEEKKNTNRDLDVVSLENTCIKAKTGVGTNDSHRILEKATACEADFHHLPFRQEIYLENCPKTTSCCGDSLTRPSEDTMNAKSPCNNALDDSIRLKPCLDNNATSHIDPNSDCLAKKPENEIIPDPLSSYCGTQDYLAIEPKNPSPIQKKWCLDLLHNTDKINRSIEDDPDHSETCFMAKESETNGNIFQANDTSNGSVLSTESDCEVSNSVDIKSENGACDSTSHAADKRGRYEDSGSSIDARDIIRNPNDPETDIGADALQDNNPKVVTFAEDKEVFDMGYVLPASVTVHLDTPVSSIAPGDVQISTDPVDSNCDSTFPITGILKTDECLDSRVQTDQETPKQPSGLNGIAVDQHDHTSFSPLYPNNLSLLSSTSSNLQKGSASYVSPIERLSPELSQENVPLPTAEEEVALKKDVIIGVDQEGRPGQSSDAAVETGPETSSATCDPRHSGEGNDTVGHHNFIVEAVAEKDLLYTDNTGIAGGTQGNETVVKPDMASLGIRARSHHAPVDAGSYSTDSNYQDTIGPLDNPQFLKTLNYTASQGFYQDEDFDARSLAGLQEPTNLDAGWAWVVLIAGFIGTSLLGACVYSAGVLMNPILEEVENDLVKASWIGSVFVCVMSFSGPFVGSVMNRIGARWTVSCAGFVLALGFLGASLSTTIAQLILTHGVVAGLGAGFTLNPLFVTVGQYFNKYRGFACGVLAMGAGAGMLGGGAFVSYLLSIFNLSGTYLVWAGVMLHIIPVGLLLQPSPEEIVRQIEKDHTLGDLKSQPDLGSMNSGRNSLFGSMNHSMLSGIDRISVGTHGRRVFVPGSLVSKRPSKLQMTSGLSNVVSEADTPLLKTMHLNDISRSSHSVNPSTCDNKSGINKSSSDLCDILSPIPIHEGREWFSHKNTPGSASQNHLSSSNDLSQSSQTLNSVGPASTHNRYQNGLQRPWTFGPQSQYTSTSHISHRLSIRSGYSSTAPRGDMDNESITSTFVSSLRPYDVITPRHTLGSRSISTLIGSVASFPTSLAIVKDDLRRLEPATPYDGTFKGYIISFLDSLRILRNKPFCIFLTTNFFWALGESPVLIHLPSYVVSRGTTPMQASSLYTSMGIASMAGRFLSGLIASDVNIGPVLMYTGSLGVAGVVVVLSPLLTNTYGQQVGFSFLVGLYTGALVPLTSLITIELLGISELSLGFGLISMAQGLGYLIGPPLSSIMVKKVGFVNAFVSAGFVLMGGSILALCMTLFLTVEDDGNEELDLDNQEDQNAFSDLHKALQKLAGDRSRSDLDGLGQDIECVDNRGEIGERRITGTDKSTPVGEELGRWSLFSTSNNTHSKGSGSARPREDGVPEGIEENINLMVLDHPGAGEINSGRECAWSNATVLNTLKEEIAPAPLDTIMEVAGK